MGPVSFDTIDIGNDRDAAMAAASTASEAGYRVDLQRVDEGFRLMVRNTDTQAVRSLLDARHTAAVFPAQLPIAPIHRPLDATVRVPGSKSHTNRALVCAALAEGTSTLDGVLFADDTEAMLSTLHELGVGLDVDRKACRVVVRGTSGSIPAGPASVNARQSGTTSRFVLPMLTLGDGTYVLDGDEQMRARPFGDLIDALHSLGGRIEGTTLPITVHAAGGLRGGDVVVPGEVSSQFLSGLLLAAPCADSATTITVTGELVSKPYIDLTLETMAAYGATAFNDGYRKLIVEPTGYTAADVSIEPDASAASYFFAAAAICGGRVTVDGLGTRTTQGDLRFVDVLEKMGAQVIREATSTTVIGGANLRGVEIDMADISDTAQSLAVVAPFASTPTRVTGIGFIRRKETDRIAAVVQELKRLGIHAVEEDDGFVIEPGRPTPGVVNTYDDHRMAMSFALLGLAAPGIVISNPGCVTKTFPEFFDVLASLG